MNARRLCSGIALTGSVWLALATAFVTHAILQAGEHAGLLQGDYGRHGHGALFPVASAGAVIGLGGCFLYVLYLANVDRRSAPSLARALRKSIGFHSVVAGALGASLILLAMESAEQLAAGSLDGDASAFGGAPLVGLGLILIVSSIFNALAAVFCNWLANAHAKLVFVVALLLRPHCGVPGPIGCHAKRTSLTTFDYVWDAAQIHGKRAPPFPAS